MAATDILIEGRFSPSFEGEYKKESFDVENEDAEEFIERWQRDQTLEHLEFSYSDQSTGTHVLLIMCKPVNWDSGKIRVTYEVVDADDPFRLVNDNQETDGEMVEVILGQNPYMFGSEDFVDICTSVEAAQEFVKTGKKAERLKWLAGFGRCECLC